MTDHNSIPERVLAEHPNYYTGTGERRCEGCGQNIEAVDGDVSVGWTLHVVTAALRAADTGRISFARSLGWYPRGTHIADAEHLVISPDGQWEQVRSDR